MNKVVEIEDCYHCPHCVCSILSAYCGVADRREIAGTCSIPPWCPLPDAAMDTRDIGPLLDELHEKYKDSPTYQAECAKNDAEADALEEMKDKRIAELMEGIAEITAELDLLKARKDRMIEKEMKAKPDPIDEATGQGRR